MAQKTERTQYVGICLDFETGGLDSKDCAITQISMQAINLETFECIDKLVAYVKPYNRQAPKKKVLKKKKDIDEEIPMIYEEKALKYSGIEMVTLEKQGVDLMDLATKVIEFITKNTLSTGKAGKPVLIGQNIPFDISFLQQLLTYAGLYGDFSKLMSGQDDHFGNFQPSYICTLQLAKALFANDQKSSACDLSSVCTRLGVELVDAHDADADVTGTVHVLAEVVHRVRNKGNSSESNDLIQKQEKVRKHFVI
ncbi:MAG: 3'-5' exonuclease [Bacteroidales bacterium]